MSQLCTVRSFCPFVILYACTYTRTHTHTHMRGDMHARTHTVTCTHARTHTDTCPLCLSKDSVAPCSLAGTDCDNHCFLSFCWPEYRLSISRFFAQKKAVDTVDFWSRKLALFSRGRWCLRQSWFLDQKAVPVHRRLFVLRTKLILGPGSGTWDKVDSWTRKLCLFAGDRWYLGQSWFLDLVVVLRTKLILGPGSCAFSPETVGT